MSREPKLSDIIKKYGWHVVSVDARGNIPGWAYTIGLHATFEHPEVVIFGLRPETLEHLVDNVAESVKAGRRFEVDMKDEELLEGYAVTFKPVDPVWYESVVRHAQKFYGNTEFPLLQLFWPDRNRKFPWDDDCDPAVKKLQPRLFEKPAQ